MVNRNDVERDWQSYAPGSRPWNLTPDLLHSGEASDGYLGMQGNRNELVGAILSAGVIDGLSTSILLGTVTVTPGILLIYDTDPAVQHYVVVAYLGGSIPGILPADVVYAQCSAGVVTLDKSQSPPSTGIILCVVIGTSQIVDVRRSAYLRGTGSSTNLPGKLLVCGKNEPDKLRVLAADGSEIFNINTQTKIVSAIATEEHAINADKLGGFQDFPDEPSPTTVSYIPVADPARTLQPNLNADQVAGKDVGNASGQIPLSNAVKNVDLNADTVDGYNFGATGLIPVGSHVRNTIDGFVPSAILEGTLGAVEVIANASPVSPVLTIKDSANIKRIIWSGGRTLTECLAEAPSSDGCIIYMMNDDASGGTILINKRVTIIGLAPYGKPTITANLQVTIEASVLCNLRINGSVLLQALNCRMLDCVVNFSGPSAVDVTANNCIIRGCFIFGDIATTNSPFILMEGSEDIFCGNTVELTITGGNSTAAVYLNTRAVCNDNKIKMTFPSGFGGIFYAFHIFSNYNAIVGNVVQFIDPLLSVTKFILRILSGDRSTLVGNTSNANSVSTGTIANNQIANNTIG